MGVDGQRPYKVWCQRDGMSIDIIAKDYEDAIRRRIKYMDYLHGYVVDRIIETDEQGISTGNDNYLSLYVEGPRCRRFYNVTFKEAKKEDVFTLIIEKVFTDPRQTRPVTSPKSAVDTGVGKVARQYAEVGFLCSWEGTDCNPETVMQFFSQVPYAVVINESEVLIRVDERVYSGSLSFLRSHPEVKYMGVDGTPFAIKESTQKSTNRKTFTLKPTSKEGWAQCGVAREPIMSEMNNRYVLNDNMVEVFADLMRVK